MLLVKMGFEDALPAHVLEQFQWRLGIMNLECLEKGHCPCNCSVPEKQIEGRQCDLQCYTDMMSEKDWDDYKTQHNITKQTIEENLYKRKDLLWK